MNIINIKKLKNKKPLKIIIPIVLGMICIIGIGIGVYSKFSHSKITSMTINQNSGTVEDEISSYFTDNPSAKPFWYYRNDETTSWIISYRKNSLKQDASNKEKLTADINLKNYSNGVQKNITIHLDSHKFGDDTKNLIWKQITSEINKLGYHNKDDSIAIRDVKEFIDNWASTDKTTWYETTNNDKITFTAGDVKINSDGAFTTALKPSTTKDGNKDVPLALKWKTKEDLKVEDIISTIKTAGYSNAPAYIWSMVKKTANEYLAKNAWAIKPKSAGNNTIVPEFHFVATKVIRSKDSNWIVTIDKKSSLKTKNLDFKSFDITLDWKNQKDALYNLKDIDTQMKDKNYTIVLTANDIYNVFHYFLRTGRWDFIPVCHQGAWREVHPEIDINTPGRGIIPSTKPGNAWTISITFIYYKHWEEWPAHYWQRFTYWGIIGLKWQFAAPGFPEIATSVVNQLNIFPNNFIFKYTPSK